MKELTEYSDNIPNISGSEELIEKAIRENTNQTVFLSDSKVDFSHIRSATAIALHMQQPLIPAGGRDLRTAEIISNLQYMMENQNTNESGSHLNNTLCYTSINKRIWVCT